MVSTRFLRDQTKSKTVIVFSPHPDDECFGCGGTIARRLSEGYEVLVVLLTDGRHAYSELFGANANPRPEELIKIRKSEEERAMRILGLEEKNLFFLGFEDGTLEQNGDEVEKKVIPLLIKHIPAEVYSAYERDFHPDHRATSRIIRTAIQKAQIETKYYEYPISPRYGPFGILAGLMLKKIMHGILYVDITNFLSLKEAAIKEFSSQISVTSETQRKPVVKNLQRFMKNKESFIVCK